VSNLKLAMDKLGQQAAQVAGLLTTEVYEPLDHFQRVTGAVATEMLGQARGLWTEIEEQRGKVETQQDRYYRLSSDAEQSDIEIEQALLEHERG